MPVALSFVRRMMKTRRAAAAAAAAAGGWQEGKQGRQQGAQKSREKLREILATGRLQRNEMRRADPRRATECLFCEVRERWGELQQPPLLRLCGVAWLQMSLMMGLLRYGAWWWSQVWGVGEALARRWYNDGCRSLEDVRRRCDLTERQRAGLKYFEDMKHRLVPPITLPPCPQRRRKAPEPSPGSSDIIIRHASTKSGVGSIAKGNTATDFSSDPCCDQTGSRGPRWSLRWRLSELLCMRSSQVMLDAMAGPY